MLKECQTNLSRKGSEFEKKKRIRAQLHRVKGGGRSGEKRKSQLALTERILRRNGYVKKLKGTPRGR